MNWAAVLTGMMPENLLLAGIVLLILNDIVRDRPSGAAALSLVVVAAAAVSAAMLSASGYAGEPFAGQLSIAPGALLAKAAVLAMALPVLLLCPSEFDDAGPLYPLMLSSLYGLLLMLSSDSFLTLFLGLELMSLPVYVMVLLAMRRPESAVQATASRPG